MYMLLKVRLCPIKPLKELIKMPKIYFIDSGFHNSALNAFGKFENRQDKGVLLENYASSVLTKKQENNIYFWRTKDKNEIDFVIESNDGKIIPLEIKATALKKAELTRGLNNFIRRYTPEKAYLANLFYTGEVNINKTKVRFVLPYEIEKIIF